MQLELVSGRIRSFIVERFPLARQLRNDGLLLEKGIIDSHGILEVVMFLENEFEITVHDEDLLPDNFRSITSMAGFVKLLLDNNSGSKE